MEMTANKEQVIEALATLDDVRTKLFDSVINVGMHGVYADINEVFEPGDSYVFELAHFDNTSDPSLQTLVNLIKHIDYSAKKILKVNNLGMEEVDV